jgi:glutamate racemase
LSLISGQVEKPIAIFDSGVGGLSVLRHIQAQLPHEPLLYLADQAHVPYGLRSPDEIRRFCEGITRFFLAEQAKLIVVACNKASAAALTHLRQRFPEVPFVGMEPAIKPAAVQTKSGKVGVLATGGTVESRRYADLMARFAQDIEVLADPCLGLVALIEAGQVSAPETEALLQICLTPMLAAGVDTLVLGCTHYPFVIPLIERIAGPAVAIIDPAPAVARQTGRVLQQYRLLSTGRQPGAMRFLTTGDKQRLTQFTDRLLDYQVEVETAVWQGDVLTTA